MTDLKYNSLNIRRIHVIENYRKAVVKFDLVNTQPVIT